MRVYRTATARGKAEQADMAADHAREDSDIAQATAKQFAPDFKQPGLDRLKAREPFRNKPLPAENALPLKPIVPNDISVKPIPNQIPPIQTNPTSKQNPHQQIQQQQQQQQHYAKNHPPDNYSSNNPNYTSPTSNFKPNQIPSSNYNPSPPQNYAQMNQTQQTVNEESSPTTHEPVQHNIDHNRLPNSNSTEMNNVANATNMALRRNSKMVHGDRPNLGSQQLSIDHFDHYKRPPSRDSSVDRYSRAAGRMSIGSRQPSVDKTSIEPDARSMRAPSAVRGTTPLPSTGNGSILTGSGAKRFVYAYVALD